MEVAKFVPFALAAVSIFIYVSLLEPNGSKETKRNDLFKLVIMLLALAGIAKYIFG